MQVRVPDSEAKQTVVCSRERFIAKPFKETGSLCLKSPELPEGFPQSTFKNQMVGGGLRSACHNSLIG